MQRSRGMDDEDAKAMLPPEASVWVQAGAHFDELSACGARICFSDAYASLVDASFRGDAAVPELLHLDQTRVRELVDKGSLYAFWNGSDRMVPWWQFDGHAIIRGLREVLAALDRELHPLVVSY